MAIKKESGGSPAPKKAPAQAAKAQASETKQQAAVEKKYTAPTKNKGEGSKAASDAVLAAAQKVPVRDAHTPIPIPAPYVGHYGQTAPPVTNISKKEDTKGGGGTGKQEPNNVVVQPPMDPTPDIPKQNPITDDVVRVAPRNVTDIASLVPQLNAEHIAKILFENVSAIELSIVERHDTIEGINQKYSIISNLAEVRKKYDTVKQLSIMDKFKPLTSIYTINIQDKIPQEDYIILENLDSTYQYLDENNQIVTREKGYYYIDTNGDLVIELINLEKNQQVEVLIDTNGTIYKVES